MKMMDDKSLLLPLFLIVIFLYCLTVSESAAIAGRGLTQRPGFVFTRARGRCTPQYWSSRGEEWPRMVPQTSTVSKVFGSRADERYRSDMTLVEATMRNDDDKAYSRLLKQGSAALLNCYARRDFFYTAWEVKTLLIQALVSDEAASLQAEHFAIANEACN